MKKVVVASDHAGLAGRDAALETVQSLDMEAIDVGPRNADSVDYPDFAHRVASMVQSGEADFGVLICGTGQGMAMSANRHPNVRAAVITDELTASMARQHNDANVACFGERVIGVEAIRKLLALFLESQFEGDRHARRVGKIELES